MLILPLAQFLVYYVWVNFNSLFLSFQRWDDNLTKFIWVDFDNFESMFNDLTRPTSTLHMATLTSLKVFGLNLILKPIQLLFPYYIYKKMIGKEFFKVMLYLPSILSAMVVALLYKYIMDEVIPELSNGAIPRLLSTKDTVFWTVWSFEAFMSFGGNILIYTSAMSRIPESLVEYAELEGCTPFQEFCKITFPLIFHTFATFMLLGITSIFTNQMGLFTFFGQNSTNTSTIGYYTYILALKGNQYYPEASSIGLFFTFIIAPLTLLFRWGVNKFAPNVQY